MNRWRYSAVSLPVFVATMSLHQSARADDVYWQAGVGDWHQATNWDLGVPTYADLAYINNGGTAQIGQYAETADFTLGDQFGDSGHAELSAGVFSPKSVEIGNHGSGTFVQTGGTMDCWWDFMIGFEEGSIGSYQMDDGSLYCDYLYVGDHGVGTFTHGGGVMQIRFDMTVGGSSTAGGSSYTQTGGSVTVQADLTISDYDSDATYSLGPAGYLQADREDIVSAFGTGSFTQTGGTHKVLTNLRVGGGNGVGTYTISAGSLDVHNFYVAYNTGHGTLAITSPAPTVTVSGLLKFGPNSTFTAVPGATIHFTGSALENENADPADLAGLANTTLIFEGGGATVDPFETAGRDFGDNVAGFANNFALASLTVGGANVGNVQLVDNTDNQPSWTGGEALYVHTLTVGAGSQLDMNNRSLYYIDAAIDPAATVLGGSPTRVIVGDTDADTDVDLDDLNVFVIAMTGPGQAPGNPTVDLDFDSDCDLSDYAVFATSFTGSQ